MPDKFAVQQNFEHVATVFTEQAYQIWCNWLQTPWVSQHTLTQDGEAGKKDQGTEIIAKQI